ncbi:hypothetical protein B0H19DRAFT_1386703 [Mycena capillaripes]|nr:hypothetical protein B0H19DRAFT_1386703 [Mycena capillaripes]
MCWPRSFCCRCPGPSPLPWPPSLTFGRSPRRPQPIFPWGLWPWTPFINSPPLPPPPPPPPAPVIPRRRRVRFNNDGPPALVQAPPMIDPHMTGPPMICPPPFMMTPSPQASAQQLNPDLCSLRGTFPYLDWDVTQFPSSALRCISEHSRDVPAFDSPAIFPPTQLITLSYADTPVLLRWENQWGPIFARGQGLHPVTLENVLDAIYQYFNQPLSPADRAMISEPAWCLISDAYYRRLPRSPNLRAYDVHRGALRVDVLNGVTKFSGLQCVGRNFLRLMLSA